MVESFRQVILIPMATVRSSSDSSSILTDEELGHNTSSSTQDVSTIRTASSNSKSAEQITSNNSYDTESWETATNSSYGKSTGDFSSVEDKRTSISISDDEEYSAGKRGWRRTDDERTSTSDSERSSYYTAHWESNNNMSNDSQSDSASGKDASGKAHSIQRRFIKSKLHHLKTSLHEPKIQDTQLTLTETLPGSEEGSLFCRNVISILERKKTTGPYEVSHLGDHAFRDSTNADNKILPNREIVNRLKIENLLSAMKKATSGDGSDDTLDSCQQCRESQEAALQRTFIRSKTSRLVNELTEQRVDWEINTKDPLTAIGDLARSLPKPRDNPQEIWTRLLDQGIT